MVTRLRATHSPRARFVVVLTLVIATACSSDGENGDAASILVGSLTTDGITFDLVLDSFTEERVCLTPVVEQAPELFGGCVQTLTADSSEQAVLGKTGTPDDPGIDAWWGATSPDVVRVAAEMRDGRTIELPIMRPSELEGRGVYCGLFMGDFTVERMVWYNAAGDEVDEQH